MHAVPRPRPGSSLRAVLGWESVWALAGLLTLACARETTLATDDGLVRARGPRSLVTGREDGAWSFRYPAGELREEGWFEDGRRTGVWTQYDPNGQVRSRGARRWNAAASRSDREGPWTFWHENGFVAAEGLFRGGLREGHWEFSNKDGSVDAARTGEYHADVKLDG